MGSSLRPITPIVSIAEPLRKQFLGVGGAVGGGSRIKIGIKMKSKLDRQILETQIGWLAFGLVCNCDLKGCNQAVCRVNIVRIWETVGARSNWRDFGVWSPRLATISR